MIQFKGVDGYDYGQMSGPAVPKCGEFVGLYTEQHDPNYGVYYVDAVIPIYGTYEGWVVIVRSPNDLSVEERLGKEAEVVLMWLRREEALRIEAENRTCELSPMTRRQITADTNECPA